MKELKDILAGTENLYKEAEEKFKGDMVFKAQDHIKKLLRRDFYLNKEKMILEHKLNKVKEKMKSNEVQLEEIKKGNTDALVNIVDKELEKEAQK